MRADRSQPSATRKRLYPYRVLHADGRIERGTAGMSDPPTYQEIRSVVQPHLNGGDLEHVTVWNDDAVDLRGDMFVDETGVLRGLPRNEQATWVYRNAALRQQPGTDPEDLPWIAGTAVVFTDRVCGV